MLAGEDFRRRHHGRLEARFYGIQHGEKRNHRLAAADVALKKPQHPVLAFHVSEDFGK